MITTLNGEKPGEKPDEQWMVNRWILDKTDKMDTQHTSNRVVSPSFSVPGFGHVQKVQPDLPEITADLT